MAEQQTPVSDLLHEPLALEEGEQSLMGRYQEWAERYPFAATTAETVALFAAKRAVGAVGDRAGANLVNGHLDHKRSQATDHPVLTATQNIIIEPILEEIAFREVIPKAIKSKLGVQETTRAANIVDTVAVLGFAVTHIGNPTAKRGRDNLAIPITPLMGGIHYNHLKRTRGLKHAMLAHMLHNALYVVGEAPKLKKVKRS